MSDASGSFGINEATSKNEFRRHRRADHTIQEVTYADVAADQFNVDRGCVHARIGRHQANVAGQCKRKSAAAGRPLDDADDGLRTPPHGNNDVPNALLQRKRGLGIAMYRLHLLLLQIETAAEIAPGSLKNHNACAALSRKPSKEIIQIGTSDV